MKMKVGATQRQRPSQTTTQTTAGAECSASVGLASGCVGESGWASGYGFCNSCTSSIPLVIVNKRFGSDESLIRERRMWRPRLWEEPRGAGIERALWGRRQY